MSLRWISRHESDPDALGFDGALLVGQVARYDLAEAGRCEVIGHYFVGFIHGERVTERCATVEEAQRGVEAHAG